MGCASWQPSAVIGELERVLECRWMGLAFCLVFFWYLEGIMGKEECRLSSSINLILFADLFYFLMKLEGEKKSAGEVRSREIFFFP